MQYIREGGGCEVDGGGDDDNDGGNGEHDDVLVVKMVVTAVVGEGDGDGSGDDDDGRGWGGRDLPPCLRVKYWLVVRDGRSAPHFCREGEKENAMFRTQNKILPAKRVSYENE